MKRKEASVVVYSRFIIIVSVQISDYVDINRGYYMAARRYDFYLRVVKTIFYERAQRVSKILFLTREDKSHILKPPCVMFCLLII